MKLLLVPRNALLSRNTSQLSRLCSVLAARQCRSFHDDGRSRLSNFWTPTGGIAKDESSDTKEDAHSLLLRGGFIRQSHSGLYQFLPLGLRVQEKIERLLDKHMRQLGASKVALSTLSSEDLWRKSGRLQGDRSELFQLEDRKGAKYLLSPTHEEEITSLVASLSHSHRDLPIRLYQITRKYRDEPRPRGGLLRSREFLMKDLYTFDLSPHLALSTYAAVRAAYASFFAALKLPILTAAASSGSIGGDLSHEYHLASPNGEDSVLVCPNCNWAANVEVLQPQSASTLAVDAHRAHSCAECNHGQLDTVAAIELGHTFHLGTKYSLPLDARVTTDAAATTTAPLQMGCHGIGVSRLIAGAAAHLADASGLNWPRAMAPFEAVVVPGKGCKEGEGEGVLDMLRGRERSEAGGEVDVVLDDREKSMVWKMKDADLIGYPVVVVLGRAWTEGRVEVQCRRLGVRREVGVDEVREVVEGLLEQL